MPEALSTNFNPFGVGALLLSGVGVAYLLRHKRREAWPLLGLLALLLFNFLFSPNFLALTVREGALFGTPVILLNQAAVVMLLAVGMTLVIAVKGIDLSVGSVMALSGAVAVMLLNHPNYGFGVSVGLALAAAAVVGLVNGILVAVIGVQPIIATLITMVGVRGVGLLVTGAKPVAVSDSTFIALGSGHFLGLPIAVSLVILVVLLAWLVCRRTALGLFIEAIGSNEEASRLAGVPDRRIKLALYTFSGLCAGVAGLVAAAYIATADPDRIGRMRELDAIFAAVIGGTALTGGRFFIGGTVLGGLLIQTLSITMYNQQVPSEIEPMPKAIVILLVCVLLSPESRAQLKVWFSRWRQA
jgi:simple sugar transport system permease protein